MCQCTPTPAPGISILITEEQHTALYNARHLLGLINNFSSVPSEFVELRLESIAVSIGLICDLLDEAVPNLVWRNKS